MKIPVRIVLVAMETRQRLQSEIDDLQREIGEIDEFIASAKSKPMPEKIEPEKSVKNVPHGTEPEPESDAPFDSSLYTSRAISDLPDNFDIQAIQDTLGVTKKQTHSLITTWTRRAWIERTSYGHYRKLPSFGGQATSAPVPSALEDEEESAPVQEQEPTPEQKSTVAKLNIEAARESLAKRLASKQRQRVATIDGSASADVLDEEIEKLEDELAALE